jgi:DNA polymerase-1
MKYISFDIETTGFKKYEGDTIFAYVLTDEEGNSDVRRLDGDKKEAKENRVFLQRQINRKDTAFIAHNAKFEISFLDACGYKNVFSKEWHDTIIQHQLLKNLDSRVALDDIAIKYFKYHCPEDDIVLEQTKKMQRELKKNNPEQRINLSCYDKVDRDVMENYQIADGERCMLAFKLMFPKIKSDKRLYQDYLNEIELLKVAVRQEKNGICFNLRRAEEYQKKLIEQCVEYKKEIVRHGFKGNPSSSAQLGPFLFEELKLKNAGKTKTEKYKVQKDYLIELYEQNSHPILEPLIRYNTNNSGVSIIDGYKELVNPITGLIHPEINTNKAVTGRQSISKPSLQNTSSQTVEDSMHGIRARGLFTAKKNHVLFFIDYSGIEFRLIVDACNEEEFIEVVNQNGNVHTVCTEYMYLDKWEEINLLCDSPTGVKIPSWVLGIEEGRKENYKLVKKMMRDGVKSYDFGIPYGGAFNAVTAGLVGLTQKEKRDADKRYALRWPKVYNFAKDTTKEVEKTGYIYTAFGRKLFVPAGKAYSGANYRIQGTASGILKRSEVRLDKYYREELNDEVRQVLPIHDELGIDYPRKLLKDAPIILGKTKRIMTTHPEIKVRLDVEAKITSSSWADARPYNLEDF